MDIIHSDTYVSLSPEQHPNYNDSNPLLKLMSLIETMQLSEKRQYYPAEDLQYLVPIEHLDIYGPSGSDYQILDPMQQDNKLDFQKQNIKDFITTDTFLIRGIVSLDNWTGPFIRISYRGGPDSQLSQLASQNGETLGDHIKMWIKIGNDATNDLVIVPYNPINNRYEIELWGYNKLDSNIKDKLSDKGKKSIESGELQIRPDLIHGSMDDFKREVLDDKDVSLISPDNVMHPILPLHIEVAWTDNSSKYWDSKHGDNYQYEFNMKVRGWKNFIGIGNSSNPHGGIGFLEYRNLFSNYGKYSHLMDLSRKLESWNFNAFGNKNHANNPENFFCSGLCGFTYCQRK